MKRYVLTGVLFFLFIGAGFCEDQKLKDPSQLFFKANAYYEERDYAKAIETYNAILDSGVESGSLYYNMANAFLKTGKIGYAILYYEKAKRMMPQDSDLRSNLAYARSLSGDYDTNAPSRNFVARMIRRPFRYLNLNALSIAVVIFFIITIAILAIFVLNPFIARRFRIILILFLAIFLLSIIAFGIRYRDEDMLRHGIIVQKDVEARYEPIDKSTTFYRLREGDGVILLKTRNGWHQVRRPDGKIGWVKKESAEEI